VNDRLTAGNASSSSSQTNWLRLGGAAADRLMSSATHAPASSSVMESAARSGTVICGYWECCVCGASGGGEPASDGNGMAMVRGRFVGEQEELQEDVAPPADKIADMQIRLAPHWSLGVSVTMS
jgi:hypothetical protein